jgi:phosphate:Na+ symporter
LLNELHDAVSSTAEKAFSAVAENNQLAAQEVIVMKADINRMMDSAAMHEARRLVAEEPDRLAAYSLEMDIIEKLKRIYYFSKRMAKAVVPEDVLGHAV